MRAEGQAEGGKWAGVEDRCVEPRMDGERLDVVNAGGGVGDELERV